MTENNEKAPISFRPSPDIEFKLWFIQDYLANNNVIETNNQSEAIRYAIDYTYKTVCKLNNIPTP